MLKFIKHIERLLVWGLLAAIAVLLVLAFIDIVYEISVTLLSPPLLIVDANGLMDLFSIFLVLLIGMELLQTVKAYLQEDIIHVELVIVVAVIAIARKVIVWDFDKYTPLELAGLAGMIVALGVTYYLIKRSNLRSINKENV